MTQPAPANEGSLPAARRQLSNAISALTDPKPHTITRDNGRHEIGWTEPLYTQLRAAIPGRKTEARGVPQSTPPLCLDAVELLHEIDATAARWEPRPEIDGSSDDPPHITIIRLRALDQRRWRPQDTSHVQHIASTINAWCEAIKTILDPPPRRHLPNPCPACGTAIVYRRNTAGETVRQPALQIGEHGCECAHCHTKWEPSYYQHLAKVLGYRLPEGVLE